MEPPADEVLRLLDDHGARLHAILVRLTLREDVAEDLMQELFLRLASSKRLGEARDRVAYAIRVAVNLALDRRRARRRGPSTELAKDDLAVHSRSPLAELVRREELEQVLDAISSLPRPGREIVVRRYLEQQDYKTIARELGKTPHQIRGLCHKAIARLRRLLVDRPTGHPETGAFGHDP
ncbi:MAG: RNA polymerase sigma factor [Thermoguttaceae bacterium]